jgi:hypothetical protein
MKYLIKENFKAVRCGRFVVADESEGEFIYNTETAYDDLHSTSLLEIAAANGLKVNKRDKKLNIVGQINAHLMTLKLPEVNKMTDTQIVEEIVEAGVPAGKSDDEMLIEIVNQGVSFKSAGKLFKSVMLAGGYRISAAERAEKANQILADADFLNPVDDDGNEVELTTEHVRLMAEHLVAEIADTTEKQAMLAIRKYAKAAEVALPKAKKGRSSSGGIVNKMSDWMLLNKDCTAEEIATQIQELKPNITEGQLNKYTTLLNQQIEFARAFAN